MASVGGSAGGGEAVEVEDQGLEVGSGVGAGRLAVESAGGALAVLGDGVGGESGPGGGVAVDRGEGLGGARCFALAL